MILDQTNKHIAIVLGEATVTTACDLTASWGSYAASAFTPGSTSAVSNGTTPVTIVAAPASGTQRLVQEITVHNNDTVTHQVTLQLIDGATTRIFRRSDVPPGGDLAYAPGGDGVLSVEPALLLETGTVGAKITGLAAFDPAAPPDGSEKLAVVEGGETTAMTLAQLLAMMIGWLQFVATNPLDQSGADGGVVQIYSGAALTGDHHGGTIDMEAGAGSGTGDGGTVYIQSGGGGASGSGGPWFAQSADGGATAGDGGAMAIQAGNANSPSGTGGQAIHVAGDGNGTNGIGGAVLYRSGSGNGTGHGGDVNVQIGIANGSGNGGNYLINGAEGGLTGGNGGQFVWNSGSARGGNGHGGNIEFNVGGGHGSGVGGDWIGAAGPGGATGAGGAVLLRGGAGGATSGNGGDVTIEAGAAGGGGSTAGLVILPVLPTAAPATSGALWYDNVTNIIHRTP